MNIETKGTTSYSVFELASRSYSQTDTSIHSGIRKCKGKDLAEFSEEGMHLLQQSREEYPQRQISINEMSVEEVNAGLMRKLFMENPAFASRSNSQYSEEEFYMMTHCDVIDPVSILNCKLGAAAQQVKDDYGIGEHCSSHEEFVTVMAKAYQFLYDEIEEGFNDPAREKTYLRREDGSYVEETKEDRLQALKRAYDQRAEGAAAAARTMMEIENQFNHGNYSMDFIEESQDRIKQTFEDAINEKNMERLRQKVARIQDYSIEFGSDAEERRIYDRIYHYM